MIIMTAMLASLAACESGDNDTKVGRAGELGRYQIRRVTWRQHTKRPFTLARDKSVAAGVAEKHLRWLALNGVRPEPIDLALAWNIGLDAYQNHRWNQSALNRAARVADGYRSLTNTLARAGSPSRAPTSASSAADSSRTRTSPPSTGLGASAGAPSDRTPGSDGSAASSVATRARLAALAPRSSPSTRPAAASP